MRDAHTAAGPNLSGWSKVASARQRTMLHRVAAVCASAIVFTPIIGPSVTLVWLVAHLCLSGVERFIVRPERGIDGAPPKGLTGLMCDALLLTNALLAIWIVIPLWMLGGTYGGMVATIYLGVGLLQAVMNGAGSIRITLMCGLPSVLAGMATPLLMKFNGAPDDAVIAAFVAVGTFNILCLSASQRLLHADRQQQAAYNLAERKRREAEAAVEARTALLAMVAHDLRTPLTAILSGSEHLSSVVPASSAAHVASINDAGVLMNALLSDLLDQSRIEAGAMNINNHSINLRDVLAQTVRLWAGPIKAKGLRFILSIDRTLPQAVLTDDIRLRQILNNLLSNAVKFTSEGTITLRASSWVDDRGDHAVTIALQDTGRGMTRQQVARVFKRFDQTADDITASFGGSGLGLSISHDLARLLGGRLTAFSEPDCGTTLTLALTLSPAPAATSVPRTLAPVASDALASEAFAPKALASKTLATKADDGLVPPSTVPAETAPTTAPTAQDTPASEPVDAPLRILVVDDHEINRRAIQLILQPFDCDLSMACDGMSALELTRTNAFDVIFMDVRMPELDGRETTRRIRAAGGPNLHTPVIAVTADNSAEDQSACLAAGMSGFISKPLTPGALIEALQTALSQSSPAEARAA